MCCADEGKDSDIVGECSNCGTGIDQYGDAVHTCHYSPCECDVCDWCPCDGSC